MLKSLSRVHKSPCQHKNPNQTGYEAELKCLNLLKKHGYQIVQHRYQTPFAEVDLVVLGKKQILVMIEVKKINNLELKNTRLGYKQRNRLKRAQLFLIEKFQRPVLLYLALVGDQEISFWELD